MSIYANHSELLLEVVGYERLTNGSGRMIILAIQAILGLWERPESFWEVINDTVGMPAKKPAPFFCTTFF